MFSQLAAREASELRSLGHEKSTKIFSPPRGKIIENIDGIMAHFVYD